MPKDLKIILVDDHSIYRDGIKAVIDQIKIGSVIAEASNGKEFLEILPDYQPDVVLMDIAMPEMDGIEATQIALKQNPDLKILVLSMYGDEAYYFKMVYAGVKGFILKTCDKKELEKAIISVSEGDSYFSVELLRNIIKNQADSKLELYKKGDKNNFISPREFDVLKLLCAAYSTTEIGQKLNLSPKTIEKHRASLLEKTSSKNTVSLVMYAIKNKLIEI